MHDVCEPENPPHSPSNVEVVGGPFCGRADWSCDLPVPAFVYFQLVNDKGLWKFSTLKDSHSNGVHCGLTTGIYFLSSIVNNIATYEWKYNNEIL